MKTPLRSLKMALTGLLSAVAFAAYADSPSSFQPVTTADRTTTNVTDIVWSAADTNGIAVTATELYDTVNSTIAFDTGDATLTYAPAANDANTDPASTTVNLQFNAAATAPDAPDGAQTAITVYIDNGATNYYVYAKGAYGDPNTPTAQAGWTQVPTLVPDTTQPVAVSITIDYNQGIAKYSVGGAEAGYYYLANTPAESKISSLNFAGSGTLSSTITTKAKAAYAIIDSGNNESYYDTLAAAETAYTSGSTLKSVAATTPYTESPVTYTVNFVDSDGTTPLDSQTLAYGAAVTYGGTTPAKADSGSNAYTWTGWNDGTTSYGTSDTLPVVTGAATYTATYKTWTLIAPPSAAQNLVYTGASQTGVAGTSDYSVSDGSGVNAGSYTATASLTDTANTMWTDKTSASKTISWSITRKAVTVAAQAQSKTYGAADPALTASVTGLLGNDTVDYSVSRTAGEDVGTYPISVSGDAVQGNYAVTYTSGVNLTISQAAVTVTADEKTKVYGASDPTLTATVTGLQRGDAASVITYSLARAVGENVGSYTITPSGAASQGNYTVAYAPNSLSITKATATVTADDKSKTYGDADPTFTATVTGLQNNDAESVITYTLARVGGEAVGTYAITPSGTATQGNYDVTYAPGELTIGEKEVTVSWSTAALTYDGTAQAPTASVSNLENGDDVSVTVSGAQTAAGTGYTATATGLTGTAAGNYSLPATAPTTTFDIAPKAIAVNWSNTSLTYDGNAQAPSATLETSDIVGTDVVNVSVSGDQTNVGTGYTATATLTGADASNYTPNPATATFAITAAEMTLSVTGYSGVYDGSAHTASATPTPSDATVVWSTDGGQSWSSTVPEITNVGTVSFQAKATKANYADATESGSLAITPKPLTVTWSNTSLTYTGSAQAPTAALSGALSGDDVSLTAVSGAQTAVGEYTATVALTGDAAGNYTASPLSQLFSISYSTHTVTWKNYDGSTLETDTDVTYDTTPSYDGATPTKTESSTETYTFAGWSTDGSTVIDPLPSVTADVVYIAVFTPVAKTGTVYWIVDGTTVETDSNVAYGTVPEFNGTAAKTGDGDGKYGYEFIGWSTAADGPVAAPTALMAASASYYAVFSTTIVTPLALALNTNATLNAVSVSGQDASVAATLSGDISGVTVDGAAFASPLTFTGIDWNAASNWAAKATQGSDATAETSTLAGRVYAKGEASWFSTNVVDGTVSDFGNIEDGIDLTAAASAAGQMVRINTRLDIGTTAATTAPNVGTARGGFAVLQLSGDTAPAFYAYNGSTWVKLYGATPAAGEHDVLIAVDTATNEAYYYVDGVSLYQVVADAPAYAISVATGTTVSAIGFANPDGVRSVSGEYDVPYVAAIGTTGYTTAAAAADALDRHGGNVLTVLGDLSGATIALAAGESVKIADFAQGAGLVMPTITAPSGYRLDPADEEGVTTFTAVPDTATVIWIAADGSQLYSTNITIGTAPVYVGETPVKGQTESTVYTFDGWSDTANGAKIDPLPVVNGPTNYYAVFTDSARTYPITWVVGESSTTVNVAWNTLPAYDGTPAKEQDNTYTYAFAAWDPAPVAVTGPAEYTATFTPTYIDYTITWNYKAADGTAASSVEDDAHYGDALTPPSVPETYVDNGTIYTFTDWSPELAQGATVTGDAIYTAQYSSAAAKATVYYLADGTVKAYYPTFAAALAAVGAGEGVALLDDVALTSTVEITKDVTINLNGNDITATGCRALWVKAGDVTITGSGTIDAEIPSNGAGSVIRVGDAVANATAAALMIDTNVVVSSATCYGVTVFGKNDTDSDPNTADISLDLYGTVAVTSSGDADAAISGQGRNDYLAVDITIHDGAAVTSANSAAVYFPGAGTLTTEGALTGKHGIVARAGNVVVNGGSVTATGTGAGEVLGDSNNTTVPYAAVVYDTSAPNVWAHYASGDKVTINAGEISSAVEPCVLQLADVGDTASVEIPAASTAIFSDADADGVPAGYALKETGENTGLYTIAQTFVVTYANYDGTALQVTTNFVNDATPAYAGSTPIRDADAQYTYTFTNFGTVAETVEDDATYTAQFSTTVNEYEITWKNGDTTLYTTNIAYGVTPVYVGATPTKAEDAQYTYTFASWSPEVAAVTGEATYTATFTPTEKTFTILWVVNGTTVETDENVAYNATPSYDGATPTKAADAQYTYTFSGWSPEVSAATADATYTATFSSTVNEYTITWTDHSGTVKSETLAYGVTPTAPAADPVQYVDNGTIYTGTWPTTSSVTGNATYAANYTAAGSAIATVITIADNAGTVTTNVLGTYTSLKAAIAAAPAGSTVVLLADDDVSFAGVQVANRIPSNGSIVIDKDLVIDGNGHTVTGVSNAEILNATAAVQPGDEAYDMAADLVDGSNLLGFFVKSGDVTFKNLTLTEFGDTAYVNKFGYTPIQTASAYADDLVLENVNIDKFNRTAVCVRGGTLTMNGGTITANATHKTDDHFQQPIEVRGGTATIDGVTVESDFLYANGGGAIVAWSDTTLTNVVVDFTGIGVWADYEDIAITGEDTSITATDKALFVEDAGSITVADGDFAGTLAVDAVAGSSITVNGGTFDQAVPEAFAGADLWPTVEREGKYTVDTKRTVTFSANDATFATVYVADGDPVAAPTAPTKAATDQYTYTFASWQTNGVDWVFSDVVESDLSLAANFTETVNEYTITFVDGSGNTLQSSDVAYGETPAYTGETPTKAATAQYTYTFTGWSPSIESVTGEATYTAQFSEELNKYTVTFTWHEDSTSTDYTYGTAKANVTVPADPASYVDNGTIYTFTGWSAEVPDTITANVTITAQYSSAAAIATVLTIAEAGATTNTVGTYASLAEAIGAAQDGDTVVLLANTTETSTLTIPADKAITLDLDGKTLTSTASPDAIYNYGTLVLQGGTINASKTLVRNLGAVTVESGTYTAGKNGIMCGIEDKSVAAPTATGCSVTVNGGSITSVEMAICTGRTADGTVTVTGGTLTSTDNAVIADNGTAGCDGHVISVSDATLNGSIISAGYVACGIYLANDDTLTVEDTEINVTGGVGILARAGDVTIGDGTEITTTGTAVGKVGDSRVVVPCAAVVFDSAAAYPGYDSTTASVSIEGGSFVSDVTTVQLVGTDEIIEIPSDSTAIFSDADAEGVPEGYALKEVENSDPTMYAIAKTWTVTFDANNGTAATTATVFDGEVVAAPAAPEKAPTAQYTYAFDAWQTNGVDWVFSDVVESDLTLVAAYTETVNQYTIIWIVDGVETTNKVDYGTAIATIQPADPTKAGDDNALYTFTSWDPAPAAVTADATYTAQFKTWTKVAVPTAASGLVYTGAEQTGVADGDGYGVIDNTGTAATSYTATASLDDTENTVWSDATEVNAAAIADKSIDWSIAKAEIAITVAGTASSATYTGAEQTADVAYAATSESALFAANKVVYSGDATVAGTTVGTYAYGLDATDFSYDDANVDATFTVTDAAFAITAATATVPTAVANLVYDGTEQTGVADGTGYTLSGDKATNAGAYTATATLAANYVWSDDTTAAKTIEWSIARKPVTVTADDASKNIGTDDPASFTATVDGTIGSDTVSYTVSREAGETAGEYVITATGDTQQGNYAVSFETGTFTINMVQYTVAWDADGGTLTGEYTSGSVDYGTALVAPTATKAEDANFTYEFLAWEPALEATVTSNMSYTATYTATPKAATVISIALNTNAVGTVANGTLAATGVSGKDVIVSAAVGAQGAGAITVTPTPASGEVAVAAGVATATFGADWNQPVEWTLAADGVAPLTGKTYLKAETAWDRASPSAEGEAVRIQASIEFDPVGPATAPTASLDDRGGITVLNGKYAAYDGSNWVALDGVAPKTGAVDLLMVADMAVAQPTVRYYIDGVALYVANSDPRQYAIPLKGTAQSLTDVTVSDPIDEVTFTAEYDVPYVAAVETANTATGYTNLADVVLSKAGETLVLLQADTALAVELSAASQTITVDYSNGSFADGYGVTAGTGFELVGVTNENVVAYSVEEAQVVTHKGATAANGVVVLATDDPDNTEHTPLTFTDITVDGNEVTLAFSAKVFLPASVEEPTVLTVLYKTDLADVEYATPALTATLSALTENGGTATVTIPQASTADAYFFFGFADGPVAQEKP